MGDDRLHDWLISRQRYWGPPIPIVHCDGCGPVRVPDDQLPVLLPAVTAAARVRPDGHGAVAAGGRRGLGADDLVPRCRRPAGGRPSVSDNFLDSSWYFLRYTSTDRGDVPWDAPRRALAAGGLLRRQAPST